MCALLHLIVISITSIGRELAYLLFPAKSWHVLSEAGLLPKFQIWNPKAKPKSQKSLKPEARDLPDCHLITVPCSFNDTYLSVAESGMIWSEEWAFL
jgi:hypothetical protein